MKNEITKEKFEDIVKNTVIDCNKSLDNWKINKDLTKYNDAKSLLRSNLAKYVKYYFGYQVYNRYIRKFEILPVISYHTLYDIEIILGVYDTENVYIKGLIDAIESVDITNFIYSKEQNKKIEPETIDLESLVNYELITNIKFK